MNVIRSCSRRYLKENKKRTVVTILGVALAAGLITATACLMVSLYASFLEDWKRTEGDFHVLYEDVMGKDLKYFQQNRNFEYTAHLLPLGLADLQTERRGKAYLYLCAADDNWYRHAGLQLSSGRLPENENEIIVGRYIRTSLGIDYKLGDQITLQIGQRVVGDRVLAMGDYYQEEESIRADMEKTYTVVGFIQKGVLSFNEGPNGGRSVPGVFAYTCLEPAKIKEDQSCNVLARYTKWGMKHYDQVNAGLSDIAGDVSVDEELLMFENVSLWNRDVGPLLALALTVFLIILLAGIFGIINSFDISLTEKIRFYGMISSVGTTRRQRRQLVWMEALYIGSIGIAGGLALGIAFSYGLVLFVKKALSRQLEFELIYRISWPGLLAAVFFSALMVFLSAVEAADRAAKISPIEAIRSNATVKNPRKPKATPGYIRKVFGMGGCIAYQNFQRVKVKYRTIVITIVVSISVFVGTSAFRYAFDAMEKDIVDNQNKFQVEVHTYSSNGFEMLKPFAKLPGVIQAEIHRSRVVQVGPGGVSRPSYQAGELPMQEQNFHAVIFTLEEESFQAYCRQVGISYEEAKGKAIVNALKISEIQEDGKVIEKEETIADFRAGDVVSGETGLENVPVSLEVVCQTKEFPPAVRSYDVILFFVDETWEKQQPGLTDPDYSGGASLYLVCEDAMAVADAIVASDPLDYYMYNYAAEYRNQKNSGLVATVFLAGFIGVIILIGITNVFNVLTTNMELRASEFARLRAMGMTGKEFRNMIWVEGLFYGGKAMLIGFPIGIFVHYLFFWVIRVGMNKEIIYEFHIPVTELLVSAAAVAILLCVIMRYCMMKIGRRNIIETIRNENI